MAVRIVSPNLEAPSVTHGFFTRQGGISSGIYASLNCGIGSNDDPDDVRENRTRVARTLKVEPERLVSPYQVHGAEAVIVKDVWEAGKGPRADALVTRTPGIAIGVGAADCGPTLFLDRRTGVIGASHSGWRGALAGVIEATVGAMETLGASRQDIVAVLGPTISRKNYEVGADFRTRFLEADEAHDRFFVTAERSGHFLFDLPAFVLSRLERAGVSGTSLGLCTYADEDRFFSYRRTTHRGESDYGRLLAAIAIVEDNPASIGSGPSHR